MFLKPLASAPPSPFGAHRQSRWKWAHGSPRQANPSLLGTTPARQHKLRRQWRFFHNSNNNRDGPNAAFVFVKAVCFSWQCTSAQLHHITKTPPLLTLLFYTQVKVPTEKEPLSLSLRALNLAERNFTHFRRRLLLFVRLVLPHFFLSSWCRSPI